MLFLAIRHLMSRKRQTTLIFLGISLGTTLFVVISGLQLGMRAFIEERLLSNSSHIRISARERIIDREDIQQRFYGDTPVAWVVPPAGKREEAHIVYPQGWFDRLRDDPAVLAYSPTLAMNVIISRGSGKYPASLIGIEPGRHQQVVDLEKYIKQGKLSDLSGGGNKVIVGSGMLEKIGIKVGDSILVSSGLGEMRPLRVVGVLELGVQGIDEVLMYAALRDVQSLNKTPGQINEIAVALVDMDRAQELADAWELTSRDNVESWAEANAQFLQIFDIQDYTRIIITVAMLIVAGFGIYNVLSIMISQKKREIAILRSIGYPPRDIIELFLIQGIVLGVTGAIIGLLLGTLLNLWLANIDVAMGHGSGVHLGISFAPSIYLQGFLLAFVSAILASILPARAAGKLTPLDIIRADI